MWERSSHCLGAARGAGLWPGSEGEGGVEVGDVGVLLMSNRACGRT